jgi:NADPH:quinone reductase-like Zn-dependent oxidoreductase
MRILIPVLASLLLTVQPVPSMHAVRIHEFGGTEVLKYEEAPRPVPAAGEVLIKVHAAGINPVDWKIRGGAFGAGSFPMILGYDVSGTIEAVADDADRFKVGDEVYAYLPLQKGGGYAEYVAAEESIVAAMPKSVDHAHAAAVPLAALTAWQALIDIAKLTEGQTVLIHAGAGGVGHFAVQIAKAHGAKVIATASKDNHEFLSSLGADQVIDYKTQKFEELVKNVDVVLDPIGGDTQERSIGVLKKGGYLVSIVQPPNQAKLKEAGISGSVFLVQPDGEQLAKLAALIDEGKIKPHVSDTFELKDAAKAHEKSQTGRTRGKIVLTVTR